MQSSVVCERMGESDWVRESLREREREKERERERERGAFIRNDLHNGGGQWGRGG
jgi:hypothetical protein